MYSRNEIELMSPVGSFESLVAAEQGGADAVYFGVGNLNMRSQSTINFSFDDLSEISSFCKNKGIKTYLTINSVIYDDEVAMMKKMVDEAKKNDISAIIATDHAVINYARQQDIEIHGSTQLNISNTEAVNFYSNYCDVMVLARELDLPKVKAISDQIIKQNITGPSGQPVKLEMFVHGALCMSISGKCYLSLHEQNYSANRGACLQPCRKSYIVKDKETDEELEIE